MNVKFLLDVFFYRVGLGCFLCANGVNSSSGYD